MERIHFFLPRVSLPQLICVLSHTRFCGTLFQRPRVDSESSSSRCHHHCRCRCLPLATTTTTVAPWLHCRCCCRLVIVTAVTTVFPPLFCDLFDCCVCSVVVSSPLPHPVVAILPTASAIVIVFVVVIVVVVYYPPPPRELFDCCVHVHRRLLVLSPRSLAPVA